MKKIGLALTTLMLLAAVAGCGALRSLTTKHFDFSYPVPAPPVIDIPTGTTAGQPFTTAVHVDVADDLARKFDRYHGGIDWAGMQYHATLTRGSDVNVKMLASVTPPSDPGAGMQAPSDAVQIEDLTLASTQGSVTKDETAGSPNEDLRSFMDYALRNTTGDLRVYIYFQVSAPNGGHILLDNVAIKGQAHGSLF